MKKRALYFTILVLFMATLFLGNGSLEPFDFDESFYRRVAEEMVISGNFVIPTLNFELHASKPPTFAWLIAGAGNLFGDGTDIGALPSRLPSSLATLVTLLMLMFFVRTHFKRTSLPEVCLPVVVWAAALLPTLGGSVVLVDPALTLALVPTLLILMTLSTEDVFLKPTLFQSLGLALSMSVASALKGPFGIVFPAFAMVLHVSLGVLFFKKKSLISTWLMLAKRFLLSFVLAGVGTAAFYFYLYKNGGERLVVDFFMVHNFGRSLNAMEGHRGPFLYHWLVLLIAGAPLVPLLLARFGRKVLDTKTVFFPHNFGLSWALACLIFFSLVATKLPNYTWPMWPGLVLAVCVFVFNEKTQKACREISETSAQWMFRIFSFLGIFPLAVLGVAFVVLAQFFPLLSSLPLDMRAKAVLSGVAEFPGSTSFALTLVGVAYIALGRGLLRVARAPLSTRLPMYAVVSLVAALLFKLNVMMFAQSILTDPFQQLAKQAAEWNDRELLLVGFTSPNASSAFPGVLIERSARDASISQWHAPILVPEWHKEVCAQNGRQVVAQKSFVLLCATASTLKN